MGECKLTNIFSRPHIRRVEVNHPALVSVTTAASVFATAVGRSTWVDIVPAARIASAARRLRRSFYSDTEIPGRCVNIDKSDRRSRTCAVTPNSSRTEVRPDLTSEGERRWSNLRDRSRSYDLGCKPAIGESEHMHAHLARSPNGRVASRPLAKASTCTRISRDLRSVRLQPNSSAKRAGTISRDLVRLQGHEIASPVRPHQGGKQARSASRWSFTRNKSAPFRLTITPENKSEVLSVRMKDSWEKDLFPRLPV